MDKYIQQVLDYISSTPKDVLLKELDSIEVCENDVRASTFVEQSIQRLVLKDIASHCFENVTAEYGNVFDSNTFSLAA